MTKVRSNVIGGRGSISSLQCTCSELKATFDCTSVQSDRSKNSTFRGYKTDIGNIN